MKSCGRRHTVLVGHNGLDVLQLSQVPELYRIPRSCGQEVAILGEGNAGHWSVGLGLKLSHILHHTNSC